MEAKFGNEVVSIVEVAIQATVTVFRDIWAKEAPNSNWDEAKFDEIRVIEKSLVAQIRRVFAEIHAEVCEENEALRAKVEQLEDVLQKKAGLLEQELEARVGQLGREMEQLEKELKSFSEGGSKVQAGQTTVTVQEDSQMIGELYTENCQQCTPFFAKSRWIFLCVKVLIQILLKVIQFRAATTRRCCRQRSIVKTVVNSLATVVASHTF